MIKIYLKSYNVNLINSFFSLLKSSSFGGLVGSGMASLPCSVKKFNIKKSPHVNGRSKENYKLSVYSGSLSIGPVRKNTFLRLNTFLRSAPLEGLGLKIFFFKI